MPTDKASKTEKTKAINPVEVTVQTLFETTRSATREAMDVTKETIESGEEALQAGFQGAVGLVKRYPAQTAAACFGVGCLLGMLSRKRF